MLAVIRRVLLRCLSMTAARLTGTGTQLTKECLMRDMKNWFFGATMWMLLCAIVVCEADSAERRGMDTRSPVQQPALQITVQLRDGSRFVGVPSITALPMRTSFAKVQLPLKDVERVEFADDQETATVTCAN